MGGWVGRCLFVSDPRFIQFALLGSCYACAHKRIVNIMKVYIERNNIQVELIRFRKNSEFIAIANFEVGIYFRDRRALFCSRGTGRFGI